MRTHFTPPTFAFLSVALVVCVLLLPQKIAAQDEPSTEEVDNSGEEEDGEEEASSDESRRSPGLPPPVWKSTQGVPVRPRGLTGPSLFSNRLGPLPKQRPPRAHGFTFGPGLQRLPR